MKFAVDDSGVVIDSYGYSSLGNRTWRENPVTGILPWYLDGDQNPISQFEQMKVGSGTTQDMTQMIGALDSPKESGGAEVTCLVRLSVAEISLGLRMARSKLPATGNTA